MVPKDLQEQKDLRVLMDHQVSRGLLVCQGLETSLAVNTRLKSLVGLVEVQMPSMMSVQRR